MYVQVVTYLLAGISEREYLDAAHQTAPRFGSVPGLLAKVWLEDATEQTYGAVYFWEDEEAMERFLRSDLFEATNPEFDEVTTEGFSVLENLTRATQPMLDIVEEPSRELRGPIAMPPAEEPAAVTAAPATRASTKRAGVRRAAKKAPAKKATSKKATTKKAVTKKAATRKAATKNAATKKAVTKKAATRKATTKEATTKRTAGKKSPGKKTPVPSRSAAKRTPRGPAKKAR